MLKQPITVLVHTTVGGPDGTKLVAGNVYELYDDPYVRILLESGTVSLVDPPSLDPEYLEDNGYELREGFSYPEKTVEEEPKVEPKEPVIKVAKKPEKISEGEADTSSDEKGSDHEPSKLQLTPPLGMGVTTSVEETPNVEGN